MNTVIVKKIVSSNLTTKIIVAMLAGIMFGLLLNVVPHFKGEDSILNILSIGDAVFLNAIKMLVIPLVLVSLICGICSLDDLKTIGLIGLKTFIWIILTTIIGLILAVTIANVLHVGADAHLKALVGNNSHQVFSLYNFFINLVPSNLMQALLGTNILQVIVFAVLFGLAINLSEDAGKRVAAFFNDLNKVIIKTVMIVMQFTPYGVFCLIAALFAKFGFKVFIELLGYFATVTLVLVIHTLCVYPILLKVIAGLSPKKFFNKMYGVMMFAFSTASSNITLPMALKVVESKLGVDNSVASFVLSLGININKNGSAIMQGVAAVFIAHAYQVDIGIVGNLMIILAAVISSISTAGVPSAGMFPLAIVLSQVGLPFDGIALILGVDRLLDMMRTSVNVAGNAVIACLIGKSERKLDLNYWAL